MIHLLLLALVPQTGTQDFRPTVDLAALPDPWTSSATRRALAAGRPVDPDGYPLDAYHPREIVVRLRRGVAADAELFHAAVGARVRERLDQGRFERVELPPGLDVPSAIRAYQALPFVEHAERNFVRRLCDLPLDPILNSPLVGQWACKRIGCERAWETTRGSEDVIIAVVDSGLSNHDDLGGATVPGFNVLDESTNVEDTFGHGTNMALTIAANDNQLGTVGVAPRCKVMPVKVSSGIELFDWDGADGITFARDHGAHVINLSFSAPSYSLLLDWATTDAVKAGCVVVVGAGNDGVEEETFPAAHPWVIAVAGSAFATDERWPLSNHGPWVDVVAPGQAVAVSADETFGQIQLDGTSSACALVSGVAGLCFSVLGTDASPDDVRQRILDHLTPVPGGWAPGRVDAGAAVLGADVPTRSSWPPDKLLKGTFQLVKGEVQDLWSVQGGDVSLDTRSVHTTKLYGSLVQHRQTVRVPLTYRVETSEGFERLEVTLEGRTSEKELTVMVSLLNWDNATFEEIGSGVLGFETDERIVVASPSGDSKRFLSAKKEVFVEYRVETVSYGTAPPAFVVEMDLARVTAIYE
jgi:subtilisin family serine protease